MKTYIFFVSHICGINGLIQYLFNKVRFLEERGWQVMIFSGVRGDILVSKMEKYKDSIYPQLFHTPYFFRQSEVNKTLNSILLKIRDLSEEDYIIESNSFHSAVWGELIASKLNCRHFIYIVQEGHNYNEEMREFLRFKYNRHELAGIIKQSVHQMLNDESVELRADTYFIAYCSNVIEDCDDVYSDKLLPNAKYTLGSFGRISKPCVPKIIDSFCIFANKHSKEIINVILIGGAQYEKDEKRCVDIIRKKLEAFNNVNLLFTGNIYPVPRSLLNKVNVFVSTSGAAYATHNEGFPTVLVTPSGEPIGVMGLDECVLKKSFYEATPDITIEDCIERGIKERESIKFPNNCLFEYAKSMNKEYDRQLSIVLRTEKGNYFDYKKLLKLKTGYPTHHFEIWLLGHLFGADGIEKAKKIWQYIRNIISSKNH